MTCPDKGQLDLWLDNALPSSDAVVVTAHTANCIRCGAWTAARGAEERQWRGALALDSVERAWLASANLAAAWRVQPVPARLAPWWPALLTFALMASYLAWQVLLPALQAPAEWATRLGAVTILTSGAIALARGILAALASINGPADSTLVIAMGSFTAWLLLARPWHLVHETHGPR